MTTPRYSRATHVTFGAAFLLEESAFRSSKCFNATNRCNEITASGGTPYYEHHRTEAVIEHNYAQYYILCTNCVWVMEIYIWDRPSKKEGCNVKSTTELFGHLQTDYPYRKKKQLIQLVSSNIVKTSWKTQFVQKYWSQFNGLWNNPHLTV